MSSADVRPAEGYSGYSADAYRLIVERQKKRLAKASSALENAEAVMRTVVEVSTSPIPLYRRIAMQRRELAALNWWHEYDQRLLSKVYAQRDQFEEQVSNLTADLIAMKAERDMWKRQAIGFTTRA